VKSAAATTEADSTDRIVPDRPLSRRAGQCAAAGRRKLLIWHGSGGMAAPAAVGRADQRHFDREKFIDERGDVGAQEPARSPCCSSSTTWRSSRVRRPVLAFTTHRHRGRTPPRRWIITRAGVDQRHQAQNRQPGSPDMLKVDKSQRLDRADPDHPRRFARRKRGRECAVLIGRKGRRRPRCCAHDGCDSGEPARPSSVMSIC